MIYPLGLCQRLWENNLITFFGEFLLYDMKNNSSIWRECIRVKIRLDVRKPLKRKKKITRKDGTEFVVICKYERMGEFCFTCGLLSHTERFCRRFIDKRSDDMEKDWGSWLRDENDLEWESRVGRCNNSTPSQEGGAVFSGKEINQERNCRSGEKQNIFKSGFSENKGHQDAIPEQNNLTSYVTKAEGEELMGLNLEERKRRRSDFMASVNMALDESVSAGVITGKLSNLDAGISASDLSVSQNPILAKLAEQASPSS